MVSICLRRCGRSETNSKKTARGICTSSHPPLCARQVNDLGAPTKEVHNGGKIHSMVPTTMSSSVANTHNALVYIRPFSLKRAGAGVEAQARATAERLQNGARTAPLGEATHHPEDLVSQ